jgi:hypothetical protein
MATSMLENGADIRYIQAILGHASLTTTQIYTRVSIQKLKEIHNATHPSKPKQSRSAFQAARVTPDANKSSLGSDPESEQTTQRRSDRSRTIIKRFAKATDPKVKTDRARFLIAALGSLSARSRRRPIFPAQRTWL